MKIDYRPNKSERKRMADQELPTLEEKVDALLEGGQKLAELKRKISEIRRKYRLDQN